MKRDYPEVFTIEIATGDSRQFVDLSRDALLALKAQIVERLG